MASTPSDGEAINDSSSLSVEQASIVRERDSLALVAFYHSTGGDSWENNEGWLSAPLADWYGVTVRGGRVTGLRSAPIS